MLTDVLSPERWMQEADCAQVDPDVWFPTRETPHREVRAATAICAECPVRDACFEYAMRTNQRHGIWGGVVMEHMKRRAH